MKVLLVEDNAELAANIAEFLESRGCTLDYAADGHLGLRLASEHRFDVVVLDIMLPGLDGLSLAARLRKESGHKLPILMLTARDTVRDKLAGFAAGGDDYLVKPFSLLELEARLRALLRRGGMADQPDKLRVADLVIDPEAHRVTRGGREVPLKPADRRLLVHLAQAGGRVVKRAELEWVLWGDAPPDSDVLRVHIHNIRAGIDRDFSPPLLQTVHGVGYRLAVPAE